jgi:2-phosphosulfolactate phosphatase
MDWGWRGAREAAARSDIVVIVDVLRFSSAVTAAVARGASVVPSLYEPATGRSFVLVPQFTEAAPGARITLSTPNGGNTTLRAAGSPQIFAGSLLNATAVAGAVARLLDESDARVTVIACGERRGVDADDGPLVFAIEDYLGAGAIISAMRHDVSPEARVCADAFTASRGRVLELLLDCGSGRELIAKGREADVRYAAQLDLLHAVPVFRDGAYVAYSG